MLQRHRRQDHSRRADAALRSAVRDERFLHRVQLPAVRNAFDRRQRRALHLQDRRQAAVDQLAVEEHRARAALPLAAAFLGAGQVQLLAQHVEQPRHRVGLDADGLAVDGERDGDVALRHH